jgi:RHS repeat-associated protein
MYELHNPGFLRLIGTTETSFMQIKSQREFFGKVDATFIVNDISQGTTQVALIDPSDNTPAVGVHLFGTSANVFSNLSPNNSVAGSFKNAWVTVRIIAGEGTASVYINDRLVKTLPFTVLNSYRLAVASIGGGCCSLHYADVSLVSATETPLNPPWVMPPLSGELVQDVVYTYDPNGNIVNLTDTSASHTAKVVDYVYDDLNRLVSASTTNASYLGNYLQTFVYDPIGNILNKSDVGNYVYNTGSFSNPHAVNSVAGENYTYDNNGNLLSAGSKTYTWNYNNQLTSVIQPDATYTYTYDPFGQRLSATNASTSFTTLYLSKYYNIDTNNKTTKHIYVNDLLLASITHSPQITHNTTPTCTPPTTGDWTVASSCTFTGTANAPASVIVNPNIVLTLSPSSKLLIDLKHYKLLVKKHGGVLIKKTATLRQLLPKDTEPTINYIHSDHLSSANVITDNAGKVVELLDYYPYGSKRLSEGSHTSQRQYIGEMFDDPTGLNYLNARYYNGTTGKFISQDPVFWNTPQQYLVDPQQWNSYSYARNNPIVLSDPSGNGPYWDNIKGYGRGFGNGLVNTVTDPVGFVVGIGQTYYSGTVSAYELTRDTISDPSGTYNSITTGLTLQYNQFETLSPEDQGNVVGNFTGQVEGGIVLGVAAGAGVKATVNSLKAPKLGSPDFIVDRGGQVFPVPKGAKGPVDVVNSSGKTTGKALVGGSGGTNGQVSTMRLMDGTTRYPNGYIKYTNDLKQGVNPSTGKTVSPSEAHYPINIKK